LWTQAARLPEKSAAQRHIEELVCELSDYVSRLYGENAEFRNADSCSAILG
jgi:hypothetical protein